MSFVNLTLNDSDLFQLSTSQQVRSFINTVYSKFE